ncbi:MAG TPA: addiction module protein [Thermoanaerobaculia bacterium]|jgi:putative addiction module component (TIGR02574 family)
MARTLDEIQHDAMTLSVEERAQLADLLLESLRTPEEQEIAAEWAAVAEARMAEIDAGSVKTIPAEESLRRARVAVEDARRTAPRR